MSIDIDIYDLLTDAGYPASAVARVMATTRWRGLHELTINEALEQGMRDQVIGVLEAFADGDII